MAKRQRKSKKDPRVEPDDSVAVEATQRTEELEEAGSERDAQLCDVKEIKDALLDIYSDVQQGFQDQADRSDDIMDYWDLYNCKLGPKQTYAGNSRIFVPIVTNAVNARKTRFANQIFPQSGRNVECISSEEQPNAIVALLEHYIRRAKLRTRVAPALLKNGDIEGSYHVCVSWRSRKREVVYRIEDALEVDNEKIPGTEDEDIKTETVEAAAPYVEVLADADVSIIPATADSVEDALEVGGCVTVIRRLSKAQIRKMEADGEFDADAATTLIEQFTGTKTTDENADKAKAMVDAAGIKTQNGRTFALVYETWTMLTHDGKRRLYRAYYGNEDLVLGCKRNPYWSDKCPVLSVPVDKVQGAVKGISKLKPCADMQYAANDAVNEGMDSAAYSMLPIIMTDPQKNPRIGSMVLNLAAIWETNPNDTQFAQFPELYKQAFEIVSSCRTEIFQTLSVTPAMMPQSSAGGSSNNQAEIAQEAAVDILSTADSVTVLEEGIFTPLLQWFAELDHQYRSRELTVRQYGPMGVRANMENIPPIQMNTRYEFRWFGVEAARNAQQTQQQIAALNVLRGIPPQEYAPYKLNWRPFISALVSDQFGARMGGEIFEDARSQLSQDPQAIENPMLLDGFDVPVHPLDDDAQHLAAHQPLMQQGDPTGMIRVHIAKHLAQQAMKTQQQMMQTGQGMPGGQPAGMPGIPGGAGPGGPQPAPGVAGTPRIGAQPGIPRMQQPPGAIHADRLKGNGIAPRR